MRATSREVSLGTAVVAASLLVGIYVDPLCLAPGFAVAAMFMTVRPIGARALFDHQEAS